MNEISVVLPEETEKLQIVPGEDLCTLMTCTPYGVNTHRLLVRGHRIENEQAAEIRISADALQIDPLLVAPFLGIPVVIILFIVIITHKRRRRS